MHLLTTAKLTSSQIQSGLGQDGLIMQGLRRPFIAFTLVRDWRHARKHPVLMEFALLHAWLASLTDPTARWDLPPSLITPGSAAAACDGRGRPI